jgi:S1-C subfamily serine protease
VSQKASFADAAGLKVGVEVVASGYALGIPGSATVTGGIVSAVPSFPLPVR